MTQYSWEYKIVLCLWGSNKFYPWIQDTWINFSDVGTWKEEISSTHKIVIFNINAIATSSELKECHFSPICKNWYHEYIAIHSIWICNMHLAEELSTSEYREGPFTFKDGPWVIANNQAWFELLQLYTVVIIYTLDNYICLNPVKFC